MQHIALRWMNKLIVMAAKYPTSLHIKMHVASPVSLPLRLRTIHRLAAHELIFKIQTTSASAHKNSESI